MTGLACDLACPGTGVERFVRSLSWVCLRIKLMMGAEQRRRSRVQRCPLRYGPPVHLCLGRLGRASFSSGARRVYFPDTLKEQETDGGGVAFQA